MASHPAPTVHGTLARSVFALLLLLSLAVLFAPASDVPLAPPGVDKVVHAVLFAALAASGRWAGIGSRVLAPLLIGYAALSEALQGLAVVGRSVSLADWVADVVGVLVGLALWASAARRGAASR